MIRIRSCAVCCRAINTNKMCFIWGEWYCDENKDKHNYNKCFEIDVKFFNESMAYTN